MSIRDLLDARDLFHVHLAHKANVFSTAVGLHLFRPDEGEPGKGRRRNAPPRTLSTARRRSDSWPSLLVFVTKWLTLAEMSNRPEDVVPQFVYLPDGRIVPICVALVDAEELPERVVNPARLVDGSPGIGSPIFVDSQGKRRMGTAACLVSDGSDVYALTNTHLAGQRGRPVSALLNGVPSVIGSTAGVHHLTEKTFSDIYPGLPGRDSVVNIDAALVDLNDVSQWDATKLPGYIGQVADFSAETASLSWIGQPVVGQGAASGRMIGEIKGLFYRYKSMGGRDYIADFVLGSREDEEATTLITQPGDSGTLWCLDRVVAPKTISPMALEWGGQRIADGPNTGKYLQLALASSLAVALREMNLDVIVDPNAERTQYWGPVGHYKIGQQACFLLKNPALKRFFTANINNISFESDATLKAAHLQAGAGFVPLSDVPDVVWKTNVNRSKRSVTRPQENWNHYADIDLPGKSGKTLLEMFDADPNSLDRQTWLDFYDAAPRPSAVPDKPLSEGSLPFRVWQIFGHMVSFAKAGDVTSFLTAAGIMAHYVGDACQPLHSSQHADGLKGASTGVHSTYEDNMVNAKADLIANGFQQAIETLKFEIPKVSSAREAGNAVMLLMKFCHETLPPETICNVYNQARPGHSKSATKTASVLDALWTSCGQATIEVIAAGAALLAVLWEAAWTASGKNPSSLTASAIAQAEIQKLYEDLTFLPSLHLRKLPPEELPGDPATAVRSAK